MEKYIERLPSWAQGPAEILAAAAEGYGAHRASRMAAAISYRTVFALAPLLIIAVAVLGSFLGSQVEAQQEIIEGIEAVVGPEVAQIVEDILTIGSRLHGDRLSDRRNPPHLDRLQPLSGDATRSQRHIRGAARGGGRDRGHGPAPWHRVPLGPRAGLPPGGDLAHQRHMGIREQSPAGLIGGGRRPGQRPHPIRLADPAPTGLRLDLQDNDRGGDPLAPGLGGGAFTAVVFLLAAYGVGIYFEIAGATTALGFAGSFVVILFLAYFLSMVFLYGAEVTKAYSDRLAAREAPAVSRPLYTDPQVVVAEPPAGIPQAAFLAFVAGLIAGWRRSRR